MDGLICQGMDRGFAVFLQGLQGCDRQKQSRDEPPCLQRPRGIPSRPGSLLTAADLADHRPVLLPQGPCSKP